MTVEELKVILELETKGFKRDANQLRKELDGVTSVAQKVKDRLRNIFSGGGGARNTSREYKNLENQIRKTERSIEDLKNKQNALGEKSRVPTSAYEAFQKQVKELEGDFDKLLKQQDDWLAAGVSPKTSAFQDLDKKMTAIGDKIRAVEGEMKALEQSGGAFTPSAKFQELQGKIEAATDDLRRFKAEQESLGSGSTGSVFTSLGEKAKAFGEKLGGLGRRAGRAFTTMGKNAISAFKNSGNQAKIGFTKILKYAFGIRSLYVLFNRLKSAVKEGFGNLSQFSSRTASDLALLKGSLTQVKDSLAVAFAPILTVIAPLIQTFVNYITAACNALAQFFGALTGQKTVTVAKSGLGDLAAGATDAADATNSANSAAQEYQRTLMGFDQINKLDDKSSGGSGGGGSAGGVGGAAGFATSEVANVYSGWADKFKEAWDKADFYGIGQAAGEKLKKALQDINWDNIKAVGEKAAKSVATGLNGFLETPGLFSTVGSTVAEALNTVFGTANTFAEKFHWTSLGTAVSDSINSFFETFNFKLAAKAISNWAKGFLDTATAAVQGVEWKKVGEKAAEFLANIEWGTLISKGFELFGSAVGAVAAAIAGFFEDAVSSVKDYFTGKIEECGGNIVEGIFTGIKDAIVGVATWIKEHIFNPFIKGFKSIFGISSPSKEMKPLGENIIAGVLEGLKNKFIDIVTWFKELPGKIKKKVGEIVTNVKAKLTEWEDNLKNKAINFKANLTKRAVAFKDKVINFIANLTKHQKKKGSFSSTIDNMVASLTSKKKAKGFSSTLGDMIASLTDKKKGKGFSSVIDNMTASLTKVSNRLSSSQKMLSMTAKITGATWSGGNSKLVGNLELTPKAKGGLFKNGKWMPVTAAAAGGAFNTGQMFVAREAGPELVGRIGANTAVMNNDQIVSSVAAGVAKAVAAVIGNGNNTTVILEGDAKGLFRAVKREATNYTNATGLAAFPV